MKTIAAAGLLFCTVCILYSTNAAAQYRGYDHGRRDYGYRHDAYRDYGYAYRRPVVAYARPVYPRYYGGYGGSGVSVIASLPFGAVAVHFGGVPYHYYRGMFYQPYGSGFMIATPPVGIVIPVLPPGCVPVMIGGMTYYNYSGTYYQPLADQGYQVVQPPQQQAPAAPDNSIGDNTYEKVVIDGKTYYKKDGTYYKAIINENGEITYEAVGQTK